MTGIRAQRLFNSQISYRYDGLIVRAILLISILFLFTPSYAGLSEYTLSGTVSIKGKQQHVASAEVMILELNMVATTDARGRFSISGLPSGKYTLSIFSSGVKTHTQRIVIKDKNIDLSFELEILQQDLDEVVVESAKENDFGITRLKAIEGTAIYASKKNEVITMEDADANLATNNSREVYAKVPSLNIWESDDAGIQLGIGGRGLSPSRVSNFNTRQNGYDISADALGYPESYYSPPTEAVERIEILRGAASLQYGTQFGGMLNFKLKSAPQDKAIEVVTRQTMGSYGLFNSFNSVGGTQNKFSYYGFFHYKTGDGWRPNSGFDVQTGHVNLGWQFNEKASLGLEYTHMNYLAQQPGGLTDAMFEDDPTQSIRERNWFEVKWNLAALKYKYVFNPSTRIELVGFGLMAGRDALGFQGPVTREDPGEERNLLSDRYRNFGTEARFLHRYMVRDHTSALLFGMRYYNGFTDRKQGLANNGSGPDFEFLDPNNPDHSAYEFPSQNIAVFTENVFNVNEKFSITPGLRFEYILTQSDGYYNVRVLDLAGNEIYFETIEDNRSKARSFMLAGLGTSYKFKPHLEWYGNISQNYRSINFNDMRIVNPNFSVDPELKDESGFSADMGIRGNIRNLLNYDVSVFLISYNDRIGEVLMVDSVLFNSYRYRTNVSDSRNYGLESFAQVNLSQLTGYGKSKNQLALFCNFSLMDARYVNSDISAFENNKVELAPNVVLKSGLTYRRGSFKATCQYSYTSSHYTDATNAEYTPNAVNGLIPSYYTADLSLQYQKGKFTFYSGINNLTDNSYFTRRASGYPGPGIIPSMGRNYYFTVQFKLASKIKGS